MKNKIKNYFVNKKYTFPKLHFKFGQISILGYVTSMLEQPRFHNKMTTYSDTECSYVANLADFNVIRVIIIVIVIKRVYNSLYLYIHYNASCN